tara:strand:+ start:917 stop:2488 length:1572 start_codon:yes stop_codon:yes gene_type:complete
LLKIFNYKHSANVLFIIIFIIICSNICPSQSHSKLSYTFSFKQDGLNIKACLKGSDKNISWLLPKFLENNSSKKHITIIDRNNEDVIYPEYDYIELQSSYGRDLCISYILDYNSVWYNDYYQDINKDRFLLLGNLSLITPDFNKDKILNIEFIWEDFNKLVNSTFGSFYNKINLKITLNELNFVYFVYGYDVIEQNNIKLIINPSCKHIINPLRDKIVKIAKKMNDEFNIKNRFKDTLIFVLNDELYNLNPGFVLSDNYNFLQIVGLNNSQIIDYKLLYTISHEFFHKIIGFLIKVNPEQQAKDYWFLEGFTDYFSTLLNLSNGIWTIDDYLKFYNKSIYNYYVYQMQNYNLNEMHGKYIYEKSGYIIGMMYAHKIDAILKEQSKELSVLKFLKLFLKKIHHNNQKYFTFQFFLKQLFDYSNIHFNDINLLNKKGELLNKKILDNSLCLIMKKMYAPYYNIDLFTLVKDLTIDDKTIVSIKRDLKNEYKYYIEVIDKKEGIKSIILDPSFHFRMVPQYVKCAK